MHVRCFFCITFLLLIHTVSMQSVTVEGVVGQNVTLPCSFDQKPKNVFWRYRDSKNVCDISGGKADFTEQDPAYRGRVNISESEVEKGNFSIMLSKVKESDAGPYTCHAPDIRSTKKVELQVNEGETTTVKGKKLITQVSTVTPSGGSRRRADGLLTFLLGCALIYSLVF